MTPRYRLAAVLGVLNFVTAYADKIGNGTRERCTSLWLAKQL